MKPVRIGIVGLGKNTRARHVPGFQAIEGVELVSVCNRSRESTRRVAEEFNIPHTFDSWQELVADERIDAVLIGTWPYMHCPITLAALDHGKHVLTEARMAGTLGEARQMLQAASEHPHLVTQIVPSPFGLYAGRQVREMLEAGFCGNLLEFTVRAANSDFADRNAPLHWRQSVELSGINLLTLGILHETLTRWIPDPVWVFSSTETFRAEATRPDSAHVLTKLANGARGIYHFSGVVHHGGEFTIELFGTEGTLRYELQSDRLLAGKCGEPLLQEVSVPGEKQARWRVEAEFVEAIRGGNPANLNDFATGLRYMEFTEAVARSARLAMPVQLPLSD